MKHTKFIAAVIAVGAVIGATGAIAKPGFGGKGGFGPRMSFEEMDTNGDGQVTKAEMKGLREARFATADANGDGKLTLAEMEAAAQARAKTRAAAMLERMDADKDGALSLDELPKPRRAGKMFDRVDANDDGAISKEEFESARAKFRGRFGGGHKPRAGAQDSETEQN
ncbi:EF-hand domain-containing protein [Phaeobacter gallaeciensis]|uniref:EF-hand domain-containing protein n=1 Tax=Phaeobacter gallaeciensis TaxID=60890 RepID=UPI000BBCB9E1|nr:EF-hand domain-containing protein [Phaeobacter gallaeciensis]ATF19100.1 EF hand/EF-hand domain protein pair [Phaeobacter gallaeciensis]ATF23209.1 EF hand/EF-hand domain protein pair [Phaeobacter gallaeciensis]